MKRALILPGLEFDSQLDALALAFRLEDGYDQVMVHALDHLRPFFPKQLAEKSMDAQQSGIDVFALKGSSIPKGQPVGKTYYESPPPFGRRIKHDLRNLPLPRAAWPQAPGTTGRIIFDIDADSAPALELLPSYMACFTTREKYPEHITKVASKPDQWKDLGPAALVTDNLSHARFWTSTQLPVAMRARVARPEWWMPSNLLAGRKWPQAWCSVQWLSRLERHLTEGQKVAEALRILRSGGVIAHQTDTVPGLAALLSSPAAIQQLTRVKERPDGKPFLVLAADHTMLRDVAAVIPKAAFDIQDKSSGAAVTFIYRARPGLPAEVLGPGHTVAVRIPQSDFLVEFIRRAGGPLVSTSANVANEPTPQKIQELNPKVLKELHYLLHLRALELDRPAAPSTLIRLVDDHQVEVLREGALAKEILAKWTRIV